MSAEAEAVTEGGVGAAAVVAWSAELGDEIVPAADDLFQRLVEPLPGGSKMESLVESGKVQARAATSRAMTIPPNRKRGAVRRG